MDRGLGFLALLVTFLLIVGAQFLYSSPGSVRPDTGAVRTPSVAAPVIAPAPAPAPVTVRAFPLDDGNRGQPLKEMLVQEDCSNVSGDAYICIETGPIRDALQAVEPSLDIHSRNLKIGQTYGTTFSLDLEPASQAGLVRFEDGGQETLDYHIGASMRFTSDAFSVSDCIEGQRDNQIDFYCNVQADKFQDSTRLITRISYYVSTKSTTFTLPAVIADLSDAVDISHTWQDKLGSFIELYKPLVLGIGAILATLLTWVSGFNKLFQSPPRETDAEEA